jgi:hypothetical protein
VEEQKLTASDATPFAYFGYSVSVSGNIVMVGAESAAVDNDTTGAAYIFGSQPTLQFNGVPASGNPVNYTAQFSPCESGFLAVVLLSCTGTSGFPLPGVARSCR